MHSEATEELALYSGHLWGEEKRAGYLLCAHVHNFPGTLDALESIRVIWHHANQHSISILMTHWSSWILPTWYYTKSNSYHSGELWWVYDGNGTFAWLLTSYGDRVPVPQGFPGWVCVNWENWLSQSSVLIVVLPLIICHCTRAIKEPWYMANCLHHSLTRM